MITVIILDNNEPKVIELTYENLWRELKDIPGSELVVSDEWFTPLQRVKNPYVCFVEPDCLVTSGYFSSQMGLLKKNPMFRKIAMMSSATGVNNWANKFYGYNIGNDYADGILPNKEKKSNQVYPVQIGYVPGSIISMSILMPTIREVKPTNRWKKDLVFLSTQLSLAFWTGGIGTKPSSYSGNRVHINPNVTYVTTEDYVNDIGKFKHDGANLADLFKRESI